MMRRMNANFDLIDDFARARTEKVMSRLIAAVKDGLFDATDIRRLAEAMAKSGSTLEFDLDTADLVSTGGPGSLSTLLGPLYLRAYGFLIPKLGVPGRPAGGIDVMAQLPGYRARLTYAEVREVIARCGYAHFLADDNFAPLDAALFNYRQAVGAQNIPALAIASLLAKKIACGIRFAGLDVRVALHGNFGGTFKEARENAKMFCAAAEAAGIKALAALTDARAAGQPFIGRGEALLALKLIFERRADPWLAEHNDRCRLMAAQVASMGTRNKTPLGTDEIETVFLENVEAQGSSPNAFHAKADAVASAKRIDMLATREGFLAVDIPAMRSIFVKVKHH
jgi:thymidine phosphorylase